MEALVQHLEKVFTETKAEERAKSEAALDEAGNFVSILS